MNGQYLSALPADGAAAGRCARELERMGVTPAGRDLAPLDRRGEGPLAHHPPRRRAGGGAAGPVARDARCQGRGADREDGPGLRRQPRRAADALEQLAPVDWTAERILER